jgi:hypothetical protein
MKQICLLIFCAVSFAVWLGNRAVGTDDFAEIQNAITDAIRHGSNGSVTLESGRTYRLEERPPDAPGPLLIIGADGLTIDGNGATLLVHPTRMVFAIAKSQRVTLKNMTIDYDPLPYTQVVIQSISPESGTITFSPMTGYVEPAVSDYNDFVPSDAMFYDRDTRKMTHSFLRLRTISQNADETFSAAFHGDPGHVSRVLAARKPGDFLTVKLPYSRGKPLIDTDGRYLSTDGTAIRVAFSKDVRVENVTLYASPNMGFTATGSQGMVLERYRVMRKPGTDRLASLCSDSAHFKSVTVMPKLTHCYFDGMMDDAVNVKVSSAKVIEKTGKKLVIDHNDIAYDDIAMESGMQVSFYDFERKKHLGFAVLHSVNRIQYRRAEIELKEDVPGILPGVLLYTCPENLLEISDCVFKSQFNNALLIRPSAVIRNCWFEDVNVAIHAISHEPIEGPMPPGLMTVENCDFIRCADAAVALYVPSLEALPFVAGNDEALKLSHSRFLLPHHEGIAIRNHNRAGIVVENIAILSGDSKKSTAPMRGL